ncbi:response regulator [Haloarcula halophila]|uniref:response regulator n=1 Tax=Haloarcula halophila TaxID=3032584 RepID=UPI0023E3C2F6|nr:response regulator [Halomicroarcula sp. DFY41]
MSSGPGEIRVLHVDDEQNLGEVVAMHLERIHEEITVTHVRSAREGLDRLGEAAFDCVVSDHDMPNMDGLEFLRCVRADYPDLPFILFTGKGNEEIASDAISAGVTEYLQKDVGTDQYTVREPHRASGQRAASEDRTRRVRADALDAYLEPPGDGLPGP